MEMNRKNLHGEISVFVILFVLVSGFAFAEERIATTGVFSIKK